MLLLLVDLLEYVEFPASGIVCHYLPQLLELGCLFTRSYFERIDAAYCLEDPLREGSNELLHHLSDPSFHLEPLELPEFVLVRRHLAIIKILELCMGLCRCSADFNRVKD